jgi:TMEM175 potassium channel family protein
VAGAEKPERSRRRTLSTRRLEAFSDGVLAIAITLLVLDITVRPPGGLADVLREWPAYLAYIVSFLTIGAVWLAHSTLTEVLARTDPILSRLNLLLLLAVSFLPFPTRLVADSLSLAPTGPERVAVTLYGLVLLTVRLLLAGLFTYASRQGLLIEALARPDSEEVAAVRRKFTPTIVAYAATVAAGLLVPAAAVAVYFGIAIFAVTPFRQIARLLRHQRSPGH